MQQNRFHCYQLMRCRAVRDGGPDVHVSVMLEDAKKYPLREIPIGSFRRRCGTHLVSLRERFAWFPDEPDPVREAHWAKLVVRHSPWVEMCETRQWGAEEDEEQGHGAE